MSRLEGPSVRGHSATPGVDASAPSVDDGLVANDMNAEDVRAHRAVMAQAVVEVQDALGYPIDEPHWLERVRPAFEELHQDFLLHRTLTEGTDGWYASIVDDAPHLGTSVEKLTAEHEELAASIASFQAALEGTGPLADPLEFRDGVTDLMHRLIKHRQRGSDLMYAAYNFDIGGQG